jgi:hypothetical protein
MNEEYLVFQVLDVCRKATDDTYPSWCNSRNDNHCCYLASAHNVRKYQMEKSIFEGIKIDKRAMSKAVPIMQSRPVPARTSLANPPKTAKDATRADVDTQLAALSAKIRDNLKRVASLTSRHHYEKAAEVCQIVATHRLRIQDLIETRNARLALEPVQDVPKVHRPGTATKVKTKRYKPWSEK